MRERLMRFRWEIMVRVSHEEKFYEVSVVEYGACETVGFVV
jgi:hypothetical protein